MLDRNVVSLIHSLRTAVGMDATSSRRARSPIECFGNGSESGSADGVVGGVVMVMVLSPGWF